MNSRTLIAAAVASACAWPLAAVARDTHSTHVSSASPAFSFSPIVTPHSVDESAPWLTAEETRARHTRGAGYVSLPNPQSPWSPNESGAVNYAEEMRDRAQRVATVGRRASPTFARTSALPVSSASAWRRSKPSASKPSVLQPPLPILHLSRQR